MQDTAPAKHPESVPASPIPRPANNRLRWFWPAVAVLVVALVGFYAFYVYPQPKITLSDFSYFTSQCSRLGNSSTEVYTYFFTLANSGSADGSALVYFYLDGSIAYLYRYSVMHGKSDRIIWSLDWPDCNSHTPRVAITEVSKTW